MPARIKLLFKALQPLKPEEVLPEKLHGLFFSLLPEELAKKFHRPVQDKPFALWFSAVQSEEVKRFSLTVSFLREEDLATFLLHFMTSPNEYRLNGKTLIRSPKPLLEDVLSYEKLYQKAGTADTLVLDFITPTAFKRNGFDYPLPDPGTVFKSLYRKWTTYSPVKLPEGLQEVIHNKLALTGCWIKTRKISLSEKAKALGFTGRAVFYTKEKDEKLLQALNALALFAEFSGVGKKTTMGMGRVRIPAEETAE